MTQTKFKKTEIGWIPEDWEVKKLGEIGTCQSGNGFPLKYQNLKAGEYPFFKVSDLSGKGNDIFLKFPNNWVREDIRKKIGAFVFPKKAIVFAKIGAAIFLERKRILFQNSCIDNNMMAFIIDTLPLDYKFIYYIFNTLSLSKLVESTALPSISKNNIENIKIPFPPIEEQHAIANVLSDVDKLIETLDDLIEKKQAIKKATMHLLLTGKKRLPGFTGEWVKRKLGEIANIRKGVQLNRDLLNSNDFYPVWNGGTEPSGYYNSYNATENSITISEGGNSCGFVNYITTKFWLGGHCYLIQPNIELNKIFLYYLLKYNEHKIMALRVGSGLPNIQVNRLEVFNIFYPIKNDEQHAIAQVLSDMDIEIEVLQARRDKLKQIKQGMMQVLLTGKIRLVENSKEEDRK